MAPTEPHPMVPAFLPLRGKRRETGDTWTLELEPARPVPFRPGQFNMVGAFGHPEVPISLSGDPDRPVLVHTIRAVGAATEALCALRKGEPVAVRGPFGVGWPVELAEGGDAVIVAGGLGLAPLRGLLYRIAATRERFRNVVVLYGGRTPAQLLFPKDLGRFRARAAMQVALTVDAAPPGWSGEVGVVPRLVERAAFDAARAVAFVCGPEAMMRFTVRSLLARGVPPGRVFLSLERNMKCAVGFCGHCQLATEFVCQDGPVFPFSRVERLLRVREL